MNGSKLQEIEMSINRRLGHRIEDLRLWAVPEGIVICGRSNSYYDKQLAQHAVMQQTGLGIAANQIAVDPGPASLSPSQRDRFAARRYLGSRFPSRRAVTE